MLEISRDDASRLLMKVTCGAVISRALAPAHRQPVRILLWFTEQGTGQASAEKVSEVEYP
jgi:hypothetical protein